LAIRARFEFAAGSWCIPAPPTPPFISTLGRPARREQATAEKEISARSDVYSLASVLYEMLTGQPPHLGGSAQAIIMKIIAEPVEVVTRYRKSVPSNVAAALARALEKVPADRFASSLASPMRCAIRRSRHVRSTRLLVRACRVGGSTGQRCRSRWRAHCCSWQRRGAGCAPRQAADGLHPVPYGWRSIRRTTFGDYPAPALSPDGTRLAFFAPDAAGVIQLWVRSLDAPAASAVPGTAGDEADLSQQPFWSPDGRSIA
jgi:eukaryotic-like serine/threonine-protein kinase